MNRDKYYSEGWRLGVAILSPLIIYLALFLVTFETREEREEREARIRKARSSGPIVVRYLPTPRESLLPGR